MMTGVRSPDGVNRAVSFFPSCLLAIVTTSTLPSLAAVLTPNSPSWRIEAPWSERLVLPSSIDLIMSSSSPS